MTSLATVLLHIIEIYTWIVIASVIFSWLFAFNVVNPRNQFVALVANALYRMTEPVLSRIRRFMPDLGGIDISPIVLLLALFLLQQVIANNLLRPAF